MPACGPNGRAVPWRMDAFDAAMVTDFDDLLPSCAGIIDSGDRHVLAAALAETVDVLRDHIHLR